MYMFLSFGHQKKELATMMKKNYLTGSAGSNTNTNTTASNEDEYEYDSSEDGTTAGSAGSEHSIDEKFYAMEMQMVFFDKRFQTD